jgi:hypothetical protein
MLSVSRFETSKIPIYCQPVVAIEGNNSEEDEDIYALPKDLVAFYALF